MDLGESDSVRAKRRGRGFGRKMVLVEVGSLSLSEALEAKGWVRIGDKNLERDGKR